MSISLIFNTIHTASNAKYTQLLHLVGLHPSFQSKVNEFYQIIQCNPTIDNIVKLGTLYFSFLIP
jgi:hypothetical protein